MRSTATLFLVCITLASIASTAQAQVVPIKIQGTATGSLITLEATGEATGSHLGRCTFVITTDDYTGDVYDLYTAADGSTFSMKRVDIWFDFTEDGRIFGEDFWEVVGGTGRFENMASAGEPIVSEFISTEPVVDPTNISLTYTKTGLIDLGRRKKK